MTTPMKQTVFTLGQASIETGKSKPTISRDIKKGKLSAKKLKNGSYEIDASELFRVYDRVTSVTVTKKENVTNDNPHETVNEIRMLQRDIKYKDEQIADLKSDRDGWKEEAKGVRLALTYQNEKSKEQELENRFEELTREIQEKIINTSQNKGVFEGLKKFFGN